MPRSERSSLWGSSSEASLASRLRQPRRRWEMLEPVPNEFHLAHARLLQLDMQSELRRARSDEESRHQLMMTPAPTMPEKGAPFGGSPTRKPVRPPKASAALPPPQEDAATNGTPRRPGLLLMKFSHDPTTYHNEHIERAKLIDKAIADQDNIVTGIRRSRSAGVIEKDPFAFVGEEAVRWDKRPHALTTTEQRAEFFPRSHRAARQCGNGLNSLLAPLEDESDAGSTAYSTSMRGSVASLSAASRSAASRA
mmetsp:Transcript_43964/g.113591  ORF Transcript_43964/g.113591 Transcript_43964/m.113591 type:complete len:252 (-) Transcript_43964:136-891(-)